MYNRRIFIQRQVYEITCRTETGLVFPPRQYIKKPFLSILAKAQELYPVVISAFVLMSNHIHMIVVVDNPEDVKDFMCYIKRESAYLVNRLLNRRQRTVWREGYDSPLLMDSETVINRLAYIYGNPAKANLVDKIEDYPNLSSWSALEAKKENYILEAPIINRKNYQPLPKRELNAYEDANFTKTLVKKENKNKVIKFELKPYEWSQCFEDTKNLSMEEIYNLVQEKLREKEAEYRDLRAEEKKSVIGVSKLNKAKIESDYEPSKYSPKSICLSVDVKRRKEYIGWYKAMCQSAYKVFCEWRKGVMEKVMPSGCFAPGGYLASLLQPEQLELC